MVDVGYMIDKAEPPSGLKRFINQRMVPQAIDAAGAVESGIYELEQQVRAQPAIAVLAAAALGLIAGGIVFRRLSGR